MEMEDLANAAKFREIKAKIDQDTSDMAAFNIAQAEAEFGDSPTKTNHQDSSVGLRVSSIFSSKGLSS